MIVPTQESLQNLVQRPTENPSFSPKSSASNVGKMWNQWYPQTMAHYQLAIIWEPWYRKMVCDHTQIVLAASSPSSPPHSAIHYFKSVYTCTRVTQSMIAFDNLFMLSN